MPAPKKYPDELRERATRLVVEARRDPASAVGAIRRIADQLGVHPEALRGWVKQAETDAGVRPGTTSSDDQRIAALEREIRELRRANQILKSAALSSTRQSNTVMIRCCSEWRKTWRSWVGRDCHRCRS
ncbi:MAG TPA: transposase, partial [Micromonosporaceae bacterium]|nr:transposase [Micromonosporaceae bacterium]